MGVIASLVSMLLLLPFMVVSLIDIWRTTNSQRQPAFLEMNVPPPRPLFSGHLANVLDRIVSLVVDLNSLGFIVTIIVGLGLCGYVVVTWLTHLVGHSQYLSAGGVGCLPW